MIGKKKFLDTYAKHPPDAFIVWYYKWFSQGKNWKNRTWIWWASIGMSMLAILLLIITDFVLSDGNSVDKRISFLFIPMAIFALMGFYVAPMNNYRIKKIREELGITPFEYKILEEKYLK